jgi:hypothetical protein
MPDREIAWSRGADIDHIEPFYKLQSTSAYIDQSAEIANIPVVRALPWSAGKLPYVQVAMDG